MDNTPEYISKEQQEAFEQFLLDDMSLTENIKFQQRLKEDAQFKAQFEAFKAMMLAVEEDGLRKKLETFHRDVETSAKKRKKQRSVKYYYPMAAGIAILITLSLWFSNRQSQNERLYESYFSPDPGLPTVMGNNDNYVFYKAMVSYKHKDYDKAIYTWKRLQESKPENDTLNYFLGAAFLAKGNTQDAILYLKTTLKNKQSVFYNEAGYYLGLAYLKQEEVELAIKELKASNYKRSKELLKEIEK